MSRVLICLKNKCPESRCWYSLIGSAVGGLSEGPGALWLLLRAAEIPVQGFPCVPRALEDTDIPSFAAPAWAGLPQTGQGCLCCPQAPGCVPVEWSLQLGWDPCGDSGAGTSLLGAKVRCSLAPPTSGCSWIWAAGHRRDTGVQRGPQAPSVPPAMQQGSHAWV